MSIYKSIMATTLALPLILTVTAQAADINIKNNVFSKPSIFITGVIKKGDYKKVITESNKLLRFIDDNQLNFILNSSGGNVEEAIKIGRFFRESLSQVYVWGNSFMHESGEGAKFIIENSAKHWTKKNLHQNAVIYSDANPITSDSTKKCYSACVLMFLGGVSKQISDNYFTVSGAKSSNSKVIPVIGLHRPYFMPVEYAKLSVNEAKDNYVKLESLVRQYLKEVGSPQSFIDRMFTKASNEIELVKDKEFRTLFHQAEPYYEEWILAKCGAFSNGEGVLNITELAKYKALTKVVIKNRMIKEGISSGKIKKYNKTLFTKLNTEVRSHNKNYQKCAFSNTLNHQRKMIESYL